MIKAVSLMRHRPIKTKRRKWNKENANLIECFGHELFQMFLRSRLSAGVYAPLVIWPNPSSSSSLHPPIPGILHYTSAAHAQWSSREAMLKLVKYWDWDSLLTPYVYFFPFFSFRPCQGPQQLTLIVRGRSPHDEL